MVLMKEKQLDVITLATQRRYSWRLTEANRKTQHKPSRKNCQKNTTAQPKQSKLFNRQSTSASEKKLRGSACPTTDKPQRNCERQRKPGQTNSPSAI
jgi:hypothetical protein